MRGYWSLWDMLTNPWYPGYVPPPPSLSSGSFTPPNLGWERSPWRFDPRETAKPLVGNPLSNIFWRPSLGLPEFWADSPEGGALHTLGDYFPSHINERLAKDASNLGGKPLDIYPSVPRGRTDALGGGLGLLASGLESLAVAVANAAYDSFVEKGLKECRRQKLMLLLANPSSAGRPTCCHIRMYSVDNSTTFSEREHKTYWYEGASLVSGTCGEHRAFLERTGVFAIPRPKRAIDETLFIPMGSPGSLVAR